MYSASSFSLSFLFIYKIIFLNIIRIVWLHMLGRSSIVAFWAVVMIRAAYSIIWAVLRGCVSFCGVGIVVGLV